MKTFRNCGIVRVKIRTLELLLGGRLRARDQIK